MLMKRSMNPMLSSLPGFQVSPVKVSVMSSLMAIMTSLALFQEHGLWRNVNGMYVPLLRLYQETGLHPTSRQLLIMNMLGLSAMV